MDVAGRQAECPNCGGPIEWKLGASAAQVCPFCRFSVVRTDRDLRAIGKVADLVPTAAPMAVGDIGRIGDSGFTVGGRLQLDHGAGPWDEFYVQMSDGRWGWIARAQGRWYLTFPMQTAGLPSWEQMTPGNTGNLPGGGDVQWTVTERGESQVLSAEGELPFATVANERGRYVDLMGPGGEMATIDYGDGSEPPKFYVGQQHPHEAISWQAGGMAERPQEMVGVQRLNCPTCGGPVPIFVPEQTERAACPACNSLLDFGQGALTFLGQLNQPQVQPYIPLGTEGTLDGEKVMCIGLMERCTTIDGVTYAWREYLIHADAGYRWLLEDSGHFTYLTPINPAEVQVSGRKATYKGRKHKLFSVNNTTVRFVIGEFYWKVQVGEHGSAADYIAPPHILSEDRTSSEVNWSAGRYVKSDEIKKAFGLTTPPPRSYDVAPAQPNPIGLLFPAIFTLVALMLLFGVYFATKKSVPITTLVEGPVAMPAQPEAAMVTRGSSTTSAGATTAPNMAQDGPSVNVSFTPEFTLPEGTDTVEIMVTSDVGHGWLGVACALIHEPSGEMREFVIEQDYFHDPGTHNYAAGRTTREKVGSLKPGTYVLRLDPRWARKTGSSGATIPPAANIKIATTNSTDSSGCCCFAAVLLLLPLPFAFLRRRLFESRRWRNSNL